MSIGMDQFAQESQLKAIEHKKAFQEIIRLASKIFASVEAKRIIAIAKNALGDA